jgi:RNA polymerase sigma factor (sigma-70 family)
MDKTFEEYWNKIDIRNIMNKVAGRYKNAIDLDDIESIKMQTLWNCIKKYDPTRGSKFTSYLYQQLSFAFKNKLKTKSIEYSNNGPVEKQDWRTSTKYEVIDVLTGLDSDLTEVINQRFYYNMTMVEIGEANGYSRETARRRLKKAIKMCQKNCVA